MTTGRQRPPQASPRPTCIRVLVAVVLAAAATMPGAADEPATRFRDATPESGIAFESGMRGIDGFPFVDLMARTSAAAGDYDNDGDIDLFIVRGDIGPNLLYRNDGGLRFTEVAAAAGLAFTRPPSGNYRHAGPTFADIDGDRDLDLFVGGLQGDPSRLFRNNGDGTFTDVTRHSGIETMGAEQTFSAAFGDYDLDGDLDLALAHWGTARPGVLDARETSRSLFTENLWRNDSDVQGIRFSRASAASGIAATILTLPDPEEPFSDGHPSRSRDWTFTPTFARIDGDRYPDLLFTADFNRSQVFLNNRDGTFRNVTDPSVFIDDHGMGSAVADFDADGDLDWFVTSVYYGGPGRRPRTRSAATACTATTAVCSPTPPMRPAWWTAAGAGPPAPSTSTTTATWTSTTPTAGSAWAATMPTTPPTDHGPSWATATAPSPTAPRRSALTTANSGGQRYAPTSTTTATSTSCCCTSPRPCGRT